MDHKGTLPPDESEIFTLHYCLISNLLYVLPYILRYTFQLTLNPH